MARYDKLESRLGHKFKDVSLLSAALTTPGFLKNKGTAQVAINYQRLEFLGDSALSLAVSELLYQELDAGEGEMTAQKSHFVCNKHLSECAKSIGLQGYVLYGGSGTPSQKILADVLEAVIGAIYVDGGIDSVLRFVKKWIYKAPLTSADLDAADHPKNKLMKLSQKIYKITPSYETLNQSDDFECVAFIPGVGSMKARGKTVKEAQARAAELLYKRLNNEEYKNA